MSSTIWRTIIIRARSSIGIVHRSTIQLGTVRRLDGLRIGGMLLAREEGGEFGAKGGTASCACWAGRARSVRRVCSIDRGAAGEEDWFSVSERGKGETEEDVRVPARVTMKRSQFNTAKAVAARVESIIPWRKFLK